MLSDLMKRLAGKRKPTASDIERAIGAIDLQKLGEALLAAEAARKEALVGGAGEAELDACDAAVERARKALDRAQVARDELQVRLAEAGEREVAEALTAERDEVEREAEAVARDLRDKWPDAHGTLLVLLERLDVAEERVKDVNRRLGDAGRGSEAVKAAEWRARACGPHEWEGAATVRARTILPEIPELGLSGHGMLATFYSPPPSMPVMHAPKAEAPRPIISFDNGTN